MRAGNEKEGEWEGGEEGGEGEEGGGGMQCLFNIISVTYMPFVYKMVCIGRDRRRVHEGRGGEYRREGEL